MSSADDVAPTAWRGGPEAPLLATRDGPSRALVAVVAILSFLAALACAGAAGIATSSAEWSRDLARAATIQVRPVPGRDLAADLDRAAALARASPVVAEATVLPLAEAERLLEPFLGRGIDLGELPVPRLVALRLARRDEAELAALSGRLQAELPPASLDDHGAWRARLGAAARLAIGGAIGLFGLVLGAAALAIAFATRGVMAGGRELVEVLALMGATDRFVAREFGRRFARFGWIGGLVGATAALALLAASWLALGRGGGAAGDGATLLGSLALGWPSLLAAALVAPVMAAVARFASAAAVKQFLKEIH